MEIRSSQALIIIRGAAHFASTEIKLEFITTAVSRCECQTWKKDTWKDLRDSISCRKLNEAENEMKFI